MQEMVEPDRTILIVSIIGLVVIWGSVAYHKFVQGGSGGGCAETGPAAQAVEADTGDSGTSASGGRHGDGQQAGGQGKKGRKSAGKKRLRKR